MMAGKLPWRNGRRVGRTLYDADDNLVGMLDTAELAARVVAAVNARQLTEAQLRGEWSAADLAEAEE